MLVSLWILRAADASYGLRSVQPASFPIPGAGPVVGTGTEYPTRMRLRAEERGTAGAIPTPSRHAAETACAARA